MPRNKSLMSGCFLSALIGLLWGGAAFLTLLKFQTAEPCCSLETSPSLSRHCGRWQCHYVSLYEREIIMKTTECGGLGNSSSDSLERADCLGGFPHCWNSGKPRALTPLAFKGGLGNLEAWRTWLLLSTDKDIGNINVGSKPSQLNYIYCANNLGLSCIN